MRKPLLFFGSIGFILCALGLAAGLIALYMRFVLFEGYRPLLYLVMLLESMGVMLFMLGFLAEAMIYFQDEISVLRKENRRMLDKLDALNDIRKKVRTVQSRIDRGESRGPRRNDSRGHGQRHEPRPPQQGQGSQGTQGPQGSQGSQGPQGAQGPKGSQEPQQSQN